MSSIKFGTYTPPKKEDLLSGNEVIQPVKAQHKFTSCYVTDMNLHDGKCAVTVVVLYDLKRYYKKQNGRVSEEEKSYRVLDVVAVALDGNGVPRAGWHEKQLFEEALVKHYKEGEKMSVVDSLLGTSITLEAKKVSMLPAIITKQDKPILASKQKANHENLVDNFLNQHTLFFGANKKIELDDAFVTTVKEIGKFTRESDITVPYAIMNKKMQDFDTIRSAFGLISFVLPLGAAYKMSQGLIALLGDVISASSLALPASDLYDLRGPVKVSNETTQIYFDKDTESGNKVYKPKGNLDIKDVIEKYH
ncbi:hypothetical protein CXF68_02810 [Tenacibaculum sp. Bg11-29]|uniref:hypothetical protein n=1 Tax=Tenacibaculum sp. Bg11-29 TaxID=2058306 RepID=UPI000C3290E5|nr:hypothetical protein [Tenacibaculum sp. Bg11-29]PKH49689.1 hypothetical protein CXF68_02810 [Tenacibaculum sp. Bg11-29]